MPTAATTLTLDLWADIACPWCWIGETRLKAAVARLRGERPDVRVEWSWRPFQLQPQLPREGVDFATHMRGKFGSDARLATMFGHVADAGAGDGLGFRFDRVTVAPNTTDAHRLVLWAQAQDDDAAVGERALATADALFRAYFAEGRDVGDRAVLTELAVAQGHDADAVRAMLASDAYELDVRDGQRDAARLGIQGVPFLVLDQRLAVSGAQPAELFDRALRAALDGGS
ncbi:DsbA family oxidoreductase [Roseisolibacter agri]|nr:DsbA family oxidoreductase [Roseisolibacter agri]